MSAPGGRRAINSLMPAAFALGFSTLTVQILTVRELLASSQGNELTLGALFGSWLFWGGIGSIVFNTKPLQSRNCHLARLLPVLAYFAPLTVVAFRFCRTILRLAPGEIAGFVQIAGVVLLFLAPFCFCSGAAFSAAVHRIRSTSLGSRGPAWFYAWEAAGALIGALIHRIVFAGRFNSLAIACVASAVLLSAYAALQPIFGRMHRFLLFLVVPAVFLSPLSGKADRWMDEILWPGFTILDSRETPYGKLHLISRENEISFLLNGSILSHSYDPLTAEETAHLPLGSHPDPRRVLVLEGGYSGIVPEILKHPVESVTLVLLDRSPLEMAAFDQLEHLIAGFDHPKVEVIQADARRFLEKLKSFSYDVIISCAPEPSSIAYNRFYTAEYYREIRRVLKSGGLYYFRIQSSENVFSPQQERYIRTAIGTLTAVFDEKSVLAIPGEPLGILARRDPDGPAGDPDVILRRLQLRNIESFYISDAYLPFRMNRHKLDRLEKMVLRSSFVLNRDMHPVLFTAYFDLWRSQFSGVSGFLSFRNGRYLATGMLIVVTGLFFWGRRKPLAGLYGSVSAVGFASISFEILLVLLLQLSTGAAYLRTGILLAIFTAGLLTGSTAAIRFKPAARIRVRMVGLIQIILALFILGPFYPGWSGGKIPEIFLDGFAFGFGFLGGMHFTFASRIIPDRTGYLYGFDLLGSAAGAFATAGFLIPVFGLIYVVFFLSIMLCATSLSLIILRDAGSVHGSA
ncbi:hypothetical protein JXA40_09060 [bacterium]|nr:hypothetical protein [candidate division CSSED10-310 bacterium]